MSASSPRIPRLRRHNGSGQGVVTIAGHDCYLGVWPAGRSKPPAAVQSAYDRLIAEWLATGRRPKVTAAELSVSELAAAYWTHRKAYHDWNNRRGDKYNVKDALRIVKELYGRTPAVDFGPIALKACREKMLGKDWSRSYINRQTNRVCQMFKWAAAEQLLPASVYQQLKCVEGLRAGKTTARETQKIRPVEQRHVDATLPFLSPILRAMVQFQLLTGCRPAEVCSVRPIDIDMGNPLCWVYRPEKHKTQHHGHDRLILIGPRAQDVLRAFLGTRVDAYCFSPLVAVAERRAQQRQARKSPMTPSQAARKHKRKSKGAPRDCYDTNTYRQAIRRGCERANAHAVANARAVNPLLPADQELVPTWAPNQLRHARATELRHHGLDLVKTVLGHSRLETTQVYAEKDIAAAMELIAKIG